MTHRQRVKDIFAGKAADRTGFWLGNPAFPRGDDKKHSAPGPLAECESVAEVEAFPWPDKKEKPCLIEQHSPPGAAAVTLAALLPATLNAAANFVFLFMCMSFISTGALATETETRGVHAVPCPRAVVIDGQLDDWDLSGQYLQCYDLEAWKDVCQGRVAFMYDANNLYISVQWLDPIPLGNSHDPRKDAGNAWKGSCLQLRVKTDCIVHVTAWYYSPSKEGAISLTYGKDLTNPFGGENKLLLPVDGTLLSENTEMAFLEGADKKSYVQEIRIPWKLLTRDWRPAAGQEFRCGVELLWGDGDWVALRCADNLDAAATTRADFFTTVNAWGKVWLEKEGKLHLPAPAWGKLAKVDNDKDTESRRIAFLGDSITGGGWEHSYGYVRLVVQGLESLGIKVTPIPAGIAGDTSDGMRRRIGSVLAAKPAQMTLSCGFNDISPACDRHVSIEDFKKNVTAILDKSQAAGVKVIILTPTLYNDSEPDNATNQKAAPYVEFLRQTAKERNLPLADLNAAHRAEIDRLKSENSPRKTLLCDGIHMNPRGDQMMATGVLKAMGLTEEQIAKAKEKWLDAAYRHPITVWRDMTVRQFEKAKAFAAKEKVEYVNNVLEPLWIRALVSAAKAAPAGADMKAVREAAQVQYGIDLDTLLESGLTIKDLKQ
jgi:lysophospholipase L1-like esterase